MSTLSKSNDSRSLNYGNDGSWKKVLFIFNPVSGRSQIRTDLVDILDGKIEEMTDKYRRGGQEDDYSFEE